MDMKHKDKKLSEANITIESLRKSILELQLENENLSSKLQDEMSNREEVLQRIQNTRDLIGLLKDQEERLEEKLSSCETERTELKYLEKEHAQQFEEMTEKFKSLEMEAGRDVEDLFKQVEQAQEFKKSLEKELEIKIAESDQQIKSLANKIDEKDIALREVHVMLQKNEEKLHSADKDLGAAQQQVCNLSAELTDAQQLLDKFKNECGLLQNEKEQLATELVEERERVESAKRQEDSVQEALNNSVAIFNQRQSDMQKDIDLLKLELCDEQKRLKEARAQLTESLTFNESLKSSRDVLLLEKTEMELCLDKLKVELTELQSEKYKNKAEISSLETEVESLQSHLEREQQAAAKLQVQVDEINPRYVSLEKEKKHLQQELHTLKQTISTHKSELEKSIQAQGEGSRQTRQLHDTITQLQAELSDKRNHIDQLHKDMTNCQTQSSAKDAEISSTTAQLDKTTSELKDLMEEQKQAKAHICDLTDQLNIYRKEKDSAEARLADLEKEKHNLQREQETKGQVAEKERQTSIEKQEHLEQQVKDLNADMKAKNKTIKDMEKELKSVRTRLTTQEKKQEEKSRELDYLKQELSASEQAKDHSDKIIASLQSHLELETEKAQLNAQQVEQLRKETAQAQKEKTESIMQCERQIIEMTATLEKYTSDHQKLLTQKDKEIDELRCKNAQLTTVSQQSECTTKELREESERLLQQIVALKSELEELEKNKAAEIESLRDQLVHAEQTDMVCDMNHTQSATQSVAHLNHSMEADSLATTSMPTTPVAQIQGQPAENPQRSILRQTGSISKRRKVAFISPSIDTSEKSNTDSESSIELEIEDQVLTHTKPGPRTPLRLRHSPHKNRSGLSAPVVLTPSKSCKLETMAKKTKLKPNTHTAVQSSSPEPIQIKDKDFCKTPNIRKAPMRTSRFFRTSPKERKMMRKQEEAKERMSWFDEDNVYGFGFDD
ncbi:uncharacterized protein LOC143283270 isoform X2 [Babylonia areolata]|uniref:uncharacterized protein LOC143283270 isoform X2 n=1 Tax=Babylonia areolata TaxID=304850 RepID=UPI003FD0CF22